MAKSNVAEIKVAPERDIDKIDELNMLLSQLCAQLAVIYGAGFESFEECREEIKDNYIWAMYCHANRAKNLCESL
jgi:hypothetical protein